MRQGREAKFWLAPSLRCYSFESRYHGRRSFPLHRRPYPPIEWSPCFPRTIRLPLAASPGSRLSRPRSTISQSDFRQVIRPSHLASLSDLTSDLEHKRRLNLTDLPCSREFLWPHAGGTNPGSIPGHLLLRILEFCLLHWEIRSAASTTIDFGAIFPFTAVPAYCLPVYAS